MLTEQPKPKPTPEPPKKTPKPKKLKRFFADVLQGIGEAIGEYMFGGNR